MPISPVQQERRQTIVISCMFRVFPCHVDCFPRYHRMEAKAHSGLELKIHGKTFTLPISYWFCSWKVLWNNTSKPCFEQGHLFLVFIEHISYSSCILRLLTLKQLVWGFYLVASCIWNTYNKSCQFKKACGRWNKFTYENAEPRLIWLQKLLVNLYKKGLKQL